MHCVFGLIVTGVGEQEFLPKLFRSLMERANCSFWVVARVGQRDQITSPARKLRMVGTGTAIPSRDETDIGLPARRFVRGGANRCLILVDDVEHDRRPMLQRVFERYRRAIDVLLSEEERRKASVHFLANMLEAYYFADSAAVNRALGADVLEIDYPGDVEEIPHPKNRLKQLHNGFDERHHGALIVPELDLDHILEDPDTCAFLRSLFGWYVRLLGAFGEVWDPELPTRYQLDGGRLHGLTSAQGIP